MEKRFDVKKAFFLLSMVVFTLFIVVPEITAQPGTSGHGVALQQLELVCITGNNSILLHQNQELANALDGVSMAPSAVYSSLQDLPTDRFYEIVIIGGDAVLDSLSPSDISLLTTMASSGTIMGILGNGVHMMEVLNIHDSSDNASLGNDSNVAFFTSGVPDGNREDALISLDNTTLKQFFDHLTDWAIPLLRSTTSAQVAATDGAWNADYSHDTRGSLDGGTYRLLVNAYNLATNHPDNDWFLVTASIQSAITDYTENSIRCGWYTRSMSVKAVVDTSSGATLYDYMPTGTVGNTTRGFSIGATLTTSQAGATATYSESYSAPDASIVDHSNYSTNTAQWDISFTGPSYTWYPFYSGPASVAKSSYQTIPAFIVQTPKNVCVSIAITPGITEEKDTLIPYTDPITWTPHVWVHDNEVSWNDPLTVNLCP